MDPGQPKVHILDYVIFAAMLLVTLAIGIYHACTGGKQRTMSEYLTGNHKLKVIPTCVSLLASSVSSVLVLGFPAETYTNGGMYWLLGVGIAVGIILATVVFVPVFYPLKLTSVNEYLYRRYDSRFVAVLGSLSSVVGMLLYASVVSFGPATAIEAATGFPTEASIVIGSLIAIVYTCIGGIKAVIWTDVFQAVLMLIGLLTITIQAVSKVGGINEVFDIAGRWDRLNIIDVSPDPTKRFTFWSLTIGSGLGDMYRYGAQQAAVQRYSSLGSLNKARICLLVIIPMAAVLTFLPCLTGITMFSYFANEGCDPLAGGFIRNPNQLVPHFVQVTLNYPGVQGILLASLVAASLSTISSLLNSGAANLWMDIIHPIWPNLTETKNVMIGKTLVVVFGAVSTALTFTLIGIGGTVVQMIVTFYASCAGPTTSMFLLGMFLPFTNWIGAAVGGFTGFIFALWIGFGSYSIKRQLIVLPTTTEFCDAYAVRLYGNLTSTTTPLPTTLASSIFAPTVMPDENPLHKLYSVSFFWLACFSMTMAFVVGLIVSLISGRMRGKTVSPELYHPWVRRFYCPDYHKDEDIVRPTENGIKSNYDYTHSKENVNIGDTYNKGDLVVTRF